MPDNQGDNRRGRWQGWDFGGGGSTPNRSPWRFSIIYIAAAVILLLVVQGLFRGSQLKAASLNQFYTQLSASNLQTVNIATDSLTWTTKDGAQFKATLPSNFQTQGLVQQLAQAGVRVTASQPSAWAGFLAQWLIPIFIFALIWIFLMRRIAGGGAPSALNLGKNRVKIYDRKEMKTTFSDVAGLDEAVEELKEIVEFLKYPKKYQRLGGRIPKGVLLLGPPGCGKTLLARAVAGEAAVPFFFMSGSEFVEMFVGLGAARVRELFNQAKERAPCLVFLDELDTIGKSRAGAFGGSFGSHDEREQTLNQLLVEMDGFDSSKGVIIMAATNRADVLDPALVRPGRFDRQVVVDRPDLRGREAILRVHTRGVAVDPSDDLHVLNERTAPVGEIDMIQRGRGGLRPAPLVRADSGVRAYRGEPGDSRRVRRAGCGAPRLDRPAVAEYGVPCRRSGERQRSRPRRGRRAVDPGSPGDGRVLEQPGGDRRHARRRRVVAHR